MFRTHVGDTVANGKMGAWWDGLGLSALFFDDDWHGVFFPLLMRAMMIRNALMDSPPAASSSGIMLRLTVAICPSPATKNDTLTPIVSKLLGESDLRCALKRHSLQKPQCPT
jgi:hypothetical protein